MHRTETISHTKTDGVSIPPPKKHHYTFRDGEKNHIQMKGHLEICSVCREIQMPLSRFGWFVALQDTWLFSTFHFLTPRP